MKFSVFRNVSFGVPDFMIMIDEKKAITIMIMIVNTGLPSYSISICCAHPCSTSEITNCCVDGVGSCAGCGGVRWAWLLASSLLDLRDAYGSLTPIQTTIQVHPGGRPIARRGSRSERAAPHPLSHGMQACGVEASISTVSPPFLSHNCFHAVDRPSVGRSESINQSSPEGMRRMPSGT